ncbi:hypothetical protein DFQ01_14425 [Paenibacillus cellulosilyticus]|uniref:Uncharacterized protein n=1 Tax=Paenibacillus cellulosilyticus TaxID=375489 RepID=A0A2V2YE36_9BACL|nr:hypothetical protein [Paenibacillus cellulosilyticus]PWV90249.1 hypothetical protein DFQ01_14425 [Paenibacillus cellulosilyticus]QKS43407.1 hypothetical protein HUB94_02480 [Paenibacillus cellulosilyticus]
MNYKAYEAQRGLNQNQANRLHETYETPSPLSPILDVMATTWQRLQIVESRLYELQSALFGAEPACDTEYYSPEPSVQSLAKGAADKAMILEQIADEMITRLVHRS